MYSAKVVEDLKTVRMLLKLHLNALAKLRSAQAYCKTKR